HTIHIEIYKFGDGVANHGIMVPFVRVDGSCSGGNGYQIGASAIFHKKLKGSVRIDGEEIMNIRLCPVYIYSRPALCNQVLLRSYHAEIGPAFEREVTRDGKGG